MSRLGAICSMGVHATVLVFLSFVTVMTVDVQPEPVKMEVAIQERAASRVPKPAKPFRHNEPSKPELRLPEIHIEFAGVDIPEVSLRLPNLLIEPVFATEENEISDDEGEVADVNEESTESVDEVVEIRTEDTEAVLKSEIRPVYPRRCRRRGHEGVVELRVVVDHSGTVKSVDVIRRSECQRLDEAAVTTVRQLKYAPATKAGVAITSEQTVRIRFALE